MSNVLADGDGSPAETYRDAEFLEAVAAGGRRTVTAEVTEHVGYSRSTARHGLRELADKGRIEGEKLDDLVWAWSPPEFDTSK